MPLLGGPELASVAASQAYSDLMLPNFRRLLGSERTWMSFYVITATVATAICVWQRCNNFLIFRAAFDHLVSGADMYVLHPAEHADLFKYSPTFALFFAPFRVLPYGPALFAWNLLNVVLIYVALRVALDPSQRLEAIQLTGIGLATTLDGTQSNGLVAALIVMAFAALERRRLRLAAMAIAGGTLIKLFPAAALALAAARRDRMRFAVSFAVIMAVAVLLPLLATTPSTLIAQYRSWYAMGAVDALDRGASVMRLMHDLVGYGGPNWPVQVIGTGLLMLPLTRRQWSDPEHRRLFLASLLVYSVIFNHKAEQPSYIIAIVGVAIWYAVGAKSALKSALTGAVFLATVPVFLAVALPQFIGSVDRPLAAAAAACTLVWIAIQVELLDLAPSTASESPSIGAVGIQAAAD